ncbi:MAG: hypothetical protein IKW80_01950 [Thermoguttaceae bacterium]|nr:hypothetical protein [Thermoguttaceae bacterium]
MSANQLDEAAYNVLEFFGGFRICLTAAPSRRTPRAESIREGFRLRQFGMHTSLRFVRLSTNA